MLPDRLLDVCQTRGIDRLAITDHNTIAGALEARALDPQRVIVGMEIMTTHGELLAFFVSEEVPPGLSPQETAQTLRSQGALISVAHAFDNVRAGGWAEADLWAILPYVDAFEVFNARTWLVSANRSAASFADRAGLLKTAGSDAHAYLEVARTVMRVPEFSDAIGLKQALLSAEIVGRRSSPLVHLLSRYAAWRKALGRHPPLTS